MSRRTFLRRGVAIAASPYLLAAAPATAAAERTDYLRYCDALMPLVERDWSAALGRYRGDDPGVTMANANLLLVHATAAGQAHRGAARQDARARSIAALLCLSPPWRESGGRGNQSHESGWLSTFDSAGFQHVVVDTPVVRGLAAAYHAREALALDGAVVVAIRDRIRACARSDFYAFPQQRLNQVNWPVEIYAHAAAVLGEADLLVRDGRKQLGRFADHLAHVAPGDRVPYTGPGYRFHYLPRQPAGSPRNVDSAEYASLVCGVLAYYEQGLEAGMEKLSRAQARRLRAWVERVLCGYWTHAGYVNWDSGFGFERWHQTKKFALCQEALLGIAAAPRLQPEPSYGAWARHLFDRGLEWYARQVRRSDGRPPAVSYGVASARGEGDERLTVARMMANACRAISLGLAGIVPEAPPPLYAYDPDTGRLAITTPAYNTAIVAVNQRAFPYGGVEPARLFDGEQRVVANVGGTGKACFGIVVRDARRRRMTATQRGRPRPDLARPPVRLKHAPRGTARRPRAYPDRAYAGPFTFIEARAETSGPTVRIISRHRFHADHIESTWDIRPRPGARGEHTVHAQFPSWGIAATVTAVLHDGSTRDLTGGSVPLSRIAWLHLAGVDGGYVVVLRSTDLPGRAKLVRPGPQKSQPHPGPTLVFELIRRARLRRRTLTVRYAPADGASAAAVASALSGA